MKYLFNTNKRIKTKNNSVITGFTLIELLAVITILSMVFTIGIYVAINVIDNTKNNSYKVTINNIESDAGSYALEDSTMLRWINGNGYQYKCITVQNLIDTGYFKGDVLDSYVSETQKVMANNYIYLERDTDSKTITKNVLLVNERAYTYNGLCENVSTEGNISIIFEPKGWSTSKNIKIYYDIYNNTLDRVSNYTYNYQYGDDSNSDKFDSLSEVEELTVYENGTLYASIKNSNDEIANASLVIDNIDNVGPVISDAYSGDEVVRSSVTIPIMLEDTQSGVNESSFVLKDVIVSIGDTILTSGVLLNKVENNHYNLVINNNVNAGLVQIRIDEDKVLDNIYNGNELTILSPLVSFTNKYTISYDANGGTGSMSDTICTYGSSCSIKNNTFSKKGYTFKGWTTKSDGTDDGYNWTGWSDNWTYVDGQYGISEGNLQLYAIWEANKYKISYNANGGTGSMDDISCTYGSSCVLKSNSFTKTGYTFKGWNTSATATAIAYNDGQSFTYDKTSNLLLYAVWEVNEYTISYNANGGTGSMSDTSCTYDSNCSVKTNSFSKTGYVFAGWTTKSDGTDDGYNWTGWSGKWSYVDGQYGISGEKLQLYARWNDTTAPTITFGNDGNNGWAKSVSSKITVSDNGSGVNASTFKYIYSTSEKATPNTVFTSGSVYSLDNVSGEYYLIAYACDNAGNCTTKISSKFYLDNTPPVIACDNTDAYIDQNFNSNGSTKRLPLFDKQDCSVSAEIYFVSGSVNVSDCDVLLATDNNSIWYSYCSNTIYNEDGVEVDNLRKTLGNCDNGYCSWIYTLSVQDQAGNTAEGSFTYKVKYQ